MKKRLCLLITLIISLFVFSGKVDAAKKMYCIYEVKENKKYVMLVQDSNGYRNILFNDKGTGSYNDAGWYETVDSNKSEYKIVFESEFYNDNLDFLSSCPNYYSIIDRKDQFVFSDEKINLQENYGLVKVNDKDDFIINAHYHFPSTDNHDAEISKTKWLGKCVYGKTHDSKLELYFNNEKYILVSYLKPSDTGQYESSERSTVTAKFTVSDLLKVINDGKACPPYLYSLKMTHMATRKDEIYLYTNQFTVPATGGSQTASWYYEKIEIPYLEGKVDIDFGPSEAPTVPIDDCKDLFGDDLVKQINKVMDVIKIAIPILLIGLGVLDFTKAIFAGNDDDMTKSKKTFFKRIIAAVLVFIAPIFVNLILSLANNVWGYISPDTCISQEK